jgi:hypothetical protein
MQNASLPNVKHTDVWHLVYAKNAGNQSTLSMDVRVPDSHSVLLDEITNTHKRYAKVGVGWLVVLALAIYGEFHPELWHPLNAFGVACAAVRVGCGSRHVDHRRTLTSHLQRR